jgi:hypothetical protein
MNDNERKEEYRVAEEFGEVGARRTDPAYTPPPGFGTDPYAGESERDLRDKSPEELEEKIDRIREEMNATLYAIERKFSPGELVDRAIHYIQGGPGDYMKNLGSAVRDNPLPSALVGIGLGWLMVSNRQGGQGFQTQSTGETGSRISEKTGRMKEKMSDAGHSISEKMHQAGEKMHSIGGRMREKKEHLSERMHERREHLSESREHLSERAQAGKERFGEMRHRSSERMHQARSGMSDMMHEQPLLLGFLGIAAGAFLGAMLPPTRQENALFGETSDRLKQQAVETGREQLQKARNVAESAAEAARGETERLYH